MSNSGLNARCEVCLLKDGWAMPIGNIMLVTINGKECLVCRQHNPKSKSSGVQNHERKTIQH